MTDYDNYNLHGQVTRDTWDWSNMPAHLRYRDNPNWSTSTAARESGDYTIGLIDEQAEVTEAAS